MSIATLTSKGQVVIPRGIRRKLHLHSGDKLDFKLEPDKSIRVVPVVKKVSEMFANEHA